MTTTAVGVLASAPLAGRCKPGLLAAHSPAWVAGLHAAMLRDTLSFAVLAASDAPSAPNDALVEAVSDTVRRDDPVVAPSEDGGYHVLGLPRPLPRLLHDLPWGTPAVLETLRVRARAEALTLRELPAWYDVDHPSDVMRLVDELRKHPERAPRTAQFLVTSG